MFFADDRGYRYIDVVPPDASTFTITDLKSSTTYYFTIAAMNQVSSSQFTSETFAVHTLGGDPAKTDGASAGGSGGGGGGRREISAAVGPSQEIILGIVAAGVLLMMLNCIFVICCIRRRNRKKLADKAAAARLPPRPQPQMYANLPYEPLPHSDPALGMRPDSQYPTERTELSDEDDEDGSNSVRTIIEVGQNGVPHHHHHVGSHGGSARQLHYVEPPPDYVEAIVPEDYIVADGYSLRGNSLQRRIPYGQPMIAHSTATGPLRSMSAELDHCMPSYAQYQPVHKNQLLRA